MNNIKLLYVEDDADFASLIQKRLLEAGFETIIAGSSGKARKLVRHFRPDIAIIDLDLQYPDEGIEVIRDIHQYNPSFPVIVYSAHAEPATVIKTMQLGVMHHVSKDRTIPELIAMLHNALRQAYRTSNSLNTEYYLSEITTYNISTRILTIRGKGTPLKYTESLLFRHLCLHLNEYVPPRELTIAVWGTEKNPADLRRYITKLRKLIEPYDPQIRLLNRAGGYYQLACEQWSRQQTGKDSPEVPLTE